MPSPIIKQFVVEGGGRFPVEMLHVDQCWPARPADAVAMGDPAMASEGRKIILATAAKYAPNRQRWMSAGWRVTD